MSLRDELEAVLTKHHPACLRLETHSCLLNDLLACYPQPSREALEELLSRYGEIPVEINLSEVGRREWKRHFQEKCDAIMAWATATGRQEPYWCPHIYSRYSKTALKERWFFRHPTVGLSADQNVMDDWDQCPVAGCHAPRPEEGWG